MGTLHFYFKVISRKKYLSFKKPSPEHPDKKIKREKISSALHYQTKKKQNESKILIIMLNVKSMIMNLTIIKRNNEK